MTFVGRLRGDAALFDPQPPQAKPGQRGRKAQKGLRLPSPKQAAAQADRSCPSFGEQRWQEVTVTVYGVARVLWVLAYQGLWPRVLGLRPVQVVVVRDPGRVAIALSVRRQVWSASWERGITTICLAARSIEVLFRASKQVLDIEGHLYSRRQSGTWNRGSGGLCAA